MNLFFEERFWLVSQQYVTSDWEMFEITDSTCMNVLDNLASTVRNYETR